MRQFFTIMSIAAVLVFSGGLVFGANNSAQFGSSVEIVGACSIAVDDISFGTVVNKQEATAESEIRVDCTSGMPYSIGISNGANSLASRRMINSANNTRLNYELHHNSTHDNSWGDNNTMGTRHNGTGTGAVAAIPYYGKIPAGQNQAAGTFNDTLTATINF